MASAGDISVFVPTGDRVEFRATAKETGGELLEWDVSFKPPGYFVQEHVHPHQEERHEVISGRVGVRVAGQDYDLGPGESVVVAPGTPHRVFNVGVDEARLRFQVRPALRTEVILETFHGLARDGKVSRRGHPNPLQFAVLAREYDAEVRVTGPPLVVQRALLGPLAMIGRLLGYRARYPEYSGNE